jgi:putative ABC transport system permease protein
MSKEKNMTGHVAFRLLGWFCPEHLYEEIEGDLIQKFNRDLKKHGTKLANRKLLWNTLRFFRPGILLRNKPSIRLTSLDMLSNYFKVAVRVMLRNKSYSFINLFSLALGITAFAFLFLWIQNEFTYDQFHADKDRLYKAWNRVDANGKINSWDVTARVLAPTLKEEYPGVESAISYTAWGEQHLFIVGDKRIVKTSGAYADTDILTMFTFPLAKGNAKTAFKNPHSIVITESFARELFDDQEAFGQTITIGESGESLPLTITGVMKDLPANTDFHFEYIIPYTLVEEFNGKEAFWGNNSVYTFVKLKEGTDINSFNAQVKEIVKKHTKEADAHEVFLYPLTKMRLYAKFENGVQSGGRIDIIRLMGILGICLLVIACINFINLSTARAQRRSKEVAVRKVTGAFRNSLIGQFLCESLLLTFGAGVLSLMAVYMGLPYFSQLINEHLTLQFGNVNFWIGGITLLVLVGLLAGSYPAFYLSAFKPVKILKGITLSQAGKSTLRATLVVFQFGIAVSLIAAVFVVQRQIKYVQDRDAGYNKENLVYQYFTGSLKKNYQAYKNELLQLGVAESVTKTSTPITNRWSNTDGIEWEGKDPQDKTLFERIYEDSHFAITAGLTVIQGRDMDIEKFPSDSTAAVLNEAAVKAMGFTDPIGQLIKDNGTEWHVIGVIKDFILTSPFNKVEPVILFGPQQSWGFSVVHIKLNAAKSTQQNIEIMATLAKKYNPDYPFEYEFVDAAYAKKFANLEATRTITLLASFLTILIAGLGLLGLSTYLVEVRIKEIGIRKVMGGSVLSITNMLTWASIKPILIAVLIFGPLTWFAMNWWLSSYPYRISVGILTIPLAALAIIGLAILITSIQTIRAAKANPVNTLRSE